MIVQPLKPRLTSVPFWPKLALLFQNLRSFTNSPLPIGTSPSFQSRLLPKVQLFASFDESTVFAALLFYFLCPFFTSWCPIRAPHFCLISYLLLLSQQLFYSRLILLFLGFRRYGYSFLVLFPQSSSPLLLYPNLLCLCFGQLGRGQSLRTDWILDVGLRYTAMETCMRESSIRESAREVGCITIAWVGDTRGTG